MAWGCLVGDRCALIICEPFPEELRGALAMAAASGGSSPLRRAGMTPDSEGHCRVSCVDFGHSSAGTGPRWLFH